MDDYIAIHSHMWVIYCQFLGDNKRHDYMTKINFILTAIAINKTMVGRSTIARNVGLWMNHDNVTLTKYLQKKLKRSNETPPNFIKRKHPRKGEKKKQGARTKVHVSKQPKWGRPQGGRGTIKYPTLQLEATKVLWSMLGTGCCGAWFAFLRNFKRTQ